MENRSARKRLTVVAALPPPVTGMTAATRSLLEAVAEHVELRIFNLSSGFNQRGWTWKLVKALRSVLALIRLAVSRRNPGEPLYTVANSGWGLIWNVLTVGLARARGYRCLLHHQVYSYLTRHSWLMQLTDRLMGPQGTHVVLAQEMQREFLARYRSRGRFVIVSNHISQLDDVSVEAAPPASVPVVLGHLSNLTIAKGLDLVISTFRGLAQRDQRVRLILAGPTTSAVERDLIAAAEREFGRRLEYRGALYGVEKSRFFAEIDVFVFPTQYHNEAQPLVISEAFSAGKPVIAYGRGCIPSLVGTEAGVVIPAGDDFVSRAVEILSGWAADPTSYARFCAGAAQRAGILRREAVESLNEFVRDLTEGGAAESSGVACGFAGGKGMIAEFTKSQAR